MKWFRRKKPNRRTLPDEARQPAPWRRAAAWILALVSLSGGSVLITTYVRNLELERFRALEITGELDRVAPADVQIALQPYIAQGFAGIDMGAARTALESQPWVATATVRRQWPGTLAVDLREERPVATWFGTALMNADGEVFVDGAAGFSRVLPDVGGPAGTQQDMVRRLVEVQALTRAGGLELRRLVRTERRAERFWLTNGDEAVIEVRLGRRDVDARLERFVAVAWPALRARAIEVAYVDMRYTNGFAVGWKKDARERG